MNETGKKAPIKTAIRIVLFLLLFCLLFSVVSNILVTHINTGYQQVNGFYLEPKNSLDAVYIGASNCYTYWNAPMAWKEYGITVYPYAIAANRFYSTEYLIREARKTQPNALYIVTVNSITFGNLGPGEIHNLVDVMPFSLNKMAMTWYLSDVSEYSISDRMEFYFPLIRYHSRWNQLTPADFKTKELNGLKGASFYYSSKDVTEKVTYTDAKCELPEKLVSCLNNLLDYCDKEKVNVLFVAVPQAKNNFKKIEIYNAAMAMIADRGYPVLDLLAKTEDIGISYAADYSDVNHTNIHGELKYTWYLSQELIQRYGFADKRGNSDYTSWDEAYTKFVQKASPYILDLECSSGNYRKDIAAPKVSIKKNGNTVKISWTAVEGAAGYRVYRKTGKGEPWSLFFDAGKALRCTDQVTETLENTYYTVVPIPEGEPGCYGNFNYYGVRLKK